jgi:hypothetical protein
MKLLLNPCESCLELPKQIAYCVVEGECQWNFSSTVLQLQEISNCHEQVLPSTAVI